MRSSDFRDAMAQELKLIESTNNPLTITTIRKGGEQRMVIISESQYHMMLSGLDNKDKQQ